MAAHQSRLERESLFAADEITAANVATLAPSWTYKLGGNSTAVPIVVGGMMYLPSRDRVVALDGDTGAVVWEYVLPAPPPPPAGAAAPPGPGGGPGGGGPTASTRGVSYWPGDGTSPPRILFMSRANLIALDAATGTPAAGFGTDGAVDVGIPYGGTPTIFENVAIIGAASGEVPQGPAGNPRAFDVRTGAKLWEFQTVPRAGEPFNETWGNGWEGRGGTNMWGFAAPVDAERGIAYLPIAGPAANYYGGDRPGNNAFANSIVAVDARTGQYLWHFQTVHHDLWDIDMPSAGGLFEFERNGTRVPAIAHVGKSAYFYVLDRTTGQPLHEVVETPVPQGDVPTEWYSPTQPIPVRPPPLARVSFSEADRRDGRGHDGRARGRVPRVHGAQRRLLQRRAVHAVHVQGARRAAEVDDSVPRRHGRRQLGRRRSRSDERARVRDLARRRARRLGAGQGPERHVQLRGRRLEAAVRSREHQRRRTVLHVQCAARRRVRREWAPRRSERSVPAPAVGQARRRQRANGRDRLGERARLERRRCRKASSSSAAPAARGRA